MSKKIILLDMDNVIADFDTALYRRRDEFKHKLIYTEPYSAENISQINMWKTINSHPANIDIVRGVFSVDGFFATIPIMPGARQAVERLDQLSDKYDYFFCSSPSVSSRTCHSDKAQWLCRYFSYKHGNKLILTDDKTMVRGDVLIDDKVSIKGCCEPSWKHILFNNPYNLDHPKYNGQPRLVNWFDNWETLVENVLADKYFSC